MPRRRRPPAPLPTPATPDARPVPAPPGSRAAADAVVRTLARTLSVVYFRRVEVTGTDRVPAGGPLLEVANHQNGLVDAVLLMAASPRHPRFLAKSTLWKIVPLRPFLALTGAVPVYRGADTAATMSSEDRSEGNREALARAAAVLAGGGTVGVFPEGVSHDLASLQELRTGAARLALEAAGTGADVTVLPVGIFYEDKSRFRSRALIRFGEGRGVADLGLLHDADPRHAVRRLTTEIGAQLRAVGPDFASVALEGACNDLAALAADGLSERERIARRLATVASEPGSGWPELEERSASYRRGLARLGVDDEQLVAVAGRRPPGGIGGPLRAALVLPVAGAGVAVHALPYALMRRLGRMPGNVGMRSTVKLLGSFGIYTLEYAAIGLVVGRRRGALAGTAAALGAPACGWVALRTREEAAAVGGWRRATRLVTRRRQAAAELLAERQRLAGTVRELTATH